MTEPYGDLLSAIYGLTDRVNALYDLILHDSSAATRSRHPNPLNGFGRKVFSQSDEDGITLEILRRLGRTDGVFAEFGVGNGLENNTLVLAALGWRGFWVGGEDLAFDIPHPESLVYEKWWVTLDNIEAITAAALDRLDVDDVDVASLDLDGNDLHFVRRLLSRGMSPDLFIVEYNAKFIPPLRFSVAYDPGHVWHGDDYFGASLMSYVDLFAEFGYRLVCCNAQSGANAFFVKEASADVFQDIPINVSDLFVAPRFHLYNRYAHALSPATVVQALS